MASGKRKGEIPIPDNLKDYLNDAQMHTMRHLESFGWELKFIRRPVFQEPIAVMVGPKEGDYGVLEKDGELNRESEIVIRD